MKKSEILLKQQELLYNRIDNALDRRQQINIFFASLNSVITGFLFENIYAIIIIFIINIVWLYYNKYLKAINSATFKVIDEIEDKIGFKTNEKEYEYFKDKKSGANYESYVIILFIIVSFLIIVYDLIQF